MASWSVEGDRRGKLPVASEGELFGSLDQLELGPREGPRPMAIVYAPTGETVVVGLAGESWFLNHIAAEGSPSFSSHEPAAAREGTMAFSLLGEYSEVDANRLIPRDLAREALRHWFRTGTRHPGVDWIED